MKGVQKEQDMADSIQRICDRVEIDGCKYKINTDFRVWIEIEHLFLKRHKNLGEKFGRILALAYPELPPDPMGAVRGVLWFYSAGEESKKEGQAEKTKSAPVYDLKEDFDYVWGAFLGEFGIDLSEAKLHWWKFRALLCCLSDECRFSKIVGYRSMDTSEIKDIKQRRFYEKMKRTFRLKTDFEDEINEEKIADSLGMFF